MSGLEFGPIKVDPKDIENYKKRRRALFWSTILLYLTWMFSKKSREALAHSRLWKSTAHIERGQVAFEKYLASRPKLRRNEKVSTVTIKTDGKGGIVP